MAKAKKKARRDHYAQVLVPLAVAVPVIVAHESFGFGSKKRAPALAEAILDKLKDVEQGKLDIAQVLDQLEELTGLKIE